MIPATLNLFHETCQHTSHKLAAASFLFQQAEIALHTILACPPPTARACLLPAPAARPRACPSAHVSHAPGQTD